MGLDGVEIVLEVEDVFGISISDEQASRVTTVGDLVELVNELVIAKQAVDAPLMSIEPQVCLLVADQLGIPLGRVKPESRFREDLNMD